MLSGIRRLDGGVLFVVCLSLVACGGGGGGGSSPAATTPPPPPVSPTVVLTASATAVNSGDSVTLDWQSTDATQCNASGSWSGGKSVNGTETIVNVTVDSTYSLNCTGSGGSATAQVGVAIGNGSGNISVNVTVDPTTVALNATATLSWTAVNATSCTASGDWSGVQAVNGSISTQVLSRDATFELSCTDGTDNAFGSATVRVLAANLSWVPPTENIDGTPLNDLSGYRVLWGTESRNYSNSLNISDPAVTSVDIGVNIGTYFFAMKAIDSAGDESSFSNELRKTFQ